VVFDSNGNFFIRRMGKVDDNGDYTYMVIGVMKSPKELPVDHGYRFAGSDLGESIEIIVDTENTVDLKEKTKGLRADQILTSL
jgi:hypothetical protein